MARPKVYDENLARQLITRAAAMLAAGGLDALSLRPLATAAGTSTSAVYSMFGDKAGLVAAVVERARAGFLQAQRDSPVTGDPLADLTALGHAYRDWALAHPALYAVMFGGRARSGHREPPPGEPVLATSELMDDETISVLAALVRTLVSGGLLHGDVPTITMSIWAGVHGLVSLEIAGGWPVSGPAARTLYEEHLAAIGRGWQSPQSPHAAGAASG
ncbi:MAG: WHG domain-containing protein [Kineosporiaceae bacterium]|nr:WHG domain-containing protein [Kineosporiaceae bacterium]